MTNPYIVSARVERRATPPTDPVSLICERHEAQRRFQVQRAIEALERRARIEQAITHRDLPRAGPRTGTHPLVQKDLESEDDQVDLVMGIVINLLAFMAVVMAIIAILQ